jgi:hypothetical protein
MPLTKITTSGITNDAITSDKIASGTITTAKVAADAITTAKIANDAVTSDKILNSTIANADISSSAAIAYSKLNLATSIANADISSSAAIAYSKLNLATSIANADVSSSAAIAYSKLNLATSIVNADISSSAAIATTKLGTGAVLQVVNAIVGQTDIAGTAGYIGSGASITPSSASNKILVMADGYIEKLSGDPDNYAQTELRRETVSLATSNNASQYRYNIGSRMPFSINFLDSPSSTSSTQYRIFHTEISGLATYRYYQYIITLLEIKA